MEEGMFDKSLKKLKKRDKSKKAKKRKREVCMNEKVIKADNYIWHCLQDDNIEVKSETNDDDDGMKNNPDDSISKSKKKKIISDVIMINCNHCNIYQQFVSTIYSWKILLKVC